MTNVTKNQNVPDVALNLEVLVEHPGWQKKIARLKGKIVETVELSLLAQNKFKLKGGAYDLSIVLASDEKIRKLNKTHRGKDYATNVLSFPIAEGETSTIPGIPTMIGDIVLAHDVIEREAKAEGKTFTHHTLHLVAHGVLHLCGYDHMTPSQTRTMQRLEITIMDEMGIPDPYLAGMNMSD